jgi:hypothetical protein
LALPHQRTAPIDDARRVTMPLRNTVFVSYSHRDKRWLQRLRVHLTPFERNGVVEIWDDTKIAPGDKWRSEIEHAIERAAASVLLISADFLASDFVAIHELPRLLRKAERAGGSVLPIIVEPCELTVHPILASFQALNSPKRPLAAMPRVEAEHVLAAASTSIGRLFAERPARAAAGAESDLYDRLQRASMALSVLWVLHEHAADYSVTELEAALHTRSRKSAYQAVESLVANGWVEKTRTARLTKYRLTREGSGALERLAAASDGPVRRALRARVGGSTPGGSSGDRR